MSNFGDAMCGRYTLHMEAELIAKRFGLKQIKLPLQPRYNIAPSQIVAGVLYEVNTSTGELEKVLDGLKWGFTVPASAQMKGPRMIINARMEGIFERPMFKNLVAKNRCVLPANAFYEWAQSSGKPYAVQVKKGDLFGMAALYKNALDSEGNPVKLCVIVTVPPNEKMAVMHDRMPAILAPDAEAAWLDPEEKNPAKLLSLLKPYENETLDMYPISKLVNSVRVDRKECLEAYDEPETAPPVKKDKPVQLSLFDP